MRTKNNLWLYVAISTMMAVQACKKEDPEPETPKPSAEFLQGSVFVVNEGSFTVENGDISAYNPAENKTFNNLFKLMNGVHAGKVVQSMTITSSGDTGIIVVNEGGPTNHGGLYLVAMNSFQKIGQVVGVEKARYAVSRGNTAYVSNWFGTSGGVAKVNLLNLTVVSNIPTKGKGPEEILLSGNQLWAANSGGSGLDSTISVIDLSSDTVIAQFQVGHGPSALVKDADGMIWVLCRGDYGSNFMSTDDDTPAELIRINPANFAIMARFSVGSLGDHPTRMALSPDGTELFVVHNGIYRLPITSTSYSGSRVTFDPAYGVGVEGNIIYHLDARDFSSDGLLHRYNLSNGAHLEHTSAGIAPNGLARRMK